MSKATWAIQGIGIKLSDIIDLLDAELLILHVENFERDEEFDAASNEERMEMLEYLRFDEINYLCSILRKADEREMLSTSDDGEDEYYLYYSKHYPWEKPGFASMDEAKAYIATLIYSFCHKASGTAYEAILGLVEEIDETGEA